MAFGKLLEREFKINSEEKKGLFITSFVCALIIFMFAWRTTDYAFATGLIAFLIMLLMSIGSIFVFVCVPKIIALLRGYQATYTHWTSGLLTGFVVSFISYGLIPIIMPGNIEIKTIDRLRHGKVFFGENKKDMFLVLASAPLAVLFLSFLFFFLAVLTGSNLLYYGVIVGALIAFFSLLPFTKNIGAVIFFARKGTYYGLVGLTALYFLVIVSQSILPLLIIIILATIYWIFIAIKSKKKK